MTPAASCLLALLLFPAACSRAPQAGPGPQPAAAVGLKPARPTPIDEKKQLVGGATWDPAWDSIVETALPSALLASPGPRGVQNLCPRFAAMPEADKRAFWAYFFQALAGAEAGLNPDSDVHHAAVAAHDAVTHRPIRAEGLLQLSYEDARRYGCNFDFQRDRALPERDLGRSILQPANNLTCGLKILTSQVVEKRQPLLFHGSYWATLRPGTASCRHFLKQMGNVPRACGLRPAVAKARGADQ